MLKAAAEVRSSVKPAPVIVMLAPSSGLGGPVAAGGVGAPGLAAGTGESLPHTPQVRAATKTNTRKDIALLPVAQWLTGLVTNCRHEARDDESRIRFSNLAPADALRTGKKRTIGTCEFYISSSFSR